MKFKFYAFLMMAGLFPMMANAKPSFLNIETPFRCSVKSAGDLDISTTLVLKPDDFKLTFFAEGDSLPRYEVNGLNFEHKPLDEAIQELVEEADITVYTEEDYHPEMNAEAVYGELSDVMEELTKAGSSFYTYNAEQKELFLSRKGRFELKLPSNRMVMLAVLDALRGAELTDIHPNWQTDTIDLSLTRAEEEKVNQLLNTIVTEGTLLVADIQVYTVAPKSAHARWQSVVEDYGVEHVYSANNGLSGKILSMGHQRPMNGFLDTLTRDYYLTPTSQGVAIVPNNWKMRFNVGQCASVKDMDSLSVLLNTQIQNAEKMKTNITLETRAGEISSFSAVPALDNELVILGVPPLTPQGNELLLTIKIRMIRLIKGE